MTVPVGRSLSCARYHVTNFKAVRKLLLTLLEVRGSSPPMVSPAMEQVWPM